MPGSPTRKNLLKILANRGITSGLTKLSKPNLKRLVEGRSPSPISTPTNITKLTRDQLVKLAEKRGVKVTTKNTKQKIINKLGVPTLNLNSVIEKFIDDHNQPTLRMIRAHVRSYPQFKNVPEEKIKSTIRKFANIQKKQSLESVPTPSGSLPTPKYKGINVKTAYKQLFENSSSSSIKKRKLPNLLSPMSYVYNSANMNMPIGDIIKRHRGRSYNSEVSIPVGKLPRASDLLANSPSVSSSNLRRARAKLFNKPYNMKRLNVLMAKTPTSSELRRARAILKSRSSSGLENIPLAQRIPKKSSSVENIPLAQRVPKKSSSVENIPLAKSSSSSVSSSNLKKRQSLVKRLLEKYKREKKPDTKVTDKVVKQKKSNVDCIERSKIPLRDYQKAVCSALRKQRGLIAVHSVGSGKTLTAVTASQCFLQDNPAAKVIVVTPVSLIDNFKKEMEGYGILRTDKRYEFYSHAKFALDIQNHKFTPKNMEGNMLIIDEIHNYKKTPILEKLGPSGISKLSKTQKSHLLRGKFMPGRGYYVRKIAKFAKKILGLTATPIVNNIDDLRFPISILTGIDFANRAGDPEEFGDRIGVLGTNTARDSIMQMSRGLFSFYERPKDDPRFPRYDIENVYIEMPPDYFKTYTEIEQTVFPKELDYRSDATAFFTNIRNAVNKIDNTMHSPKVVWALRKIQKTIERGGKVLLYSVWLNSGIKMIADHLKKSDIGYNFISGDIPQKQRQQIVKDYNSGKKPVLLISKAGGEGLDLKGTTVAIMLEPVWNPATEMQVFGRAVRSGSHIGLPRDKQYVKCYLLFLIKPGEKILQNAQDAFSHKELIKQPNGSSAFAHAADQIINGFVILKRKDIKSIYREISRYGIEKKQFVPWSANRRVKVTK